ncbi:hypothetical protein CE206_28705 (plasmid) [Achromobacter xylosoxidans]|uniref:hypothetical protein n=1 Tax=Alcaligenes xylosoxydans xylosoxydans TaxID=85698 RepID=UPI000DD146B8|nr:hypothetical protein [Achromobacter xylosoxidans]AXA80562.1 hypothetical protein CE206_28705 [Achromobacter xylosoxidans]
MMNFLWATVAESLSAFYLSFYLDPFAWTLGAIVAGFGPGFCGGWGRAQSLYRQDMERSRREYRGTPLRYRRLSAVIISVVTVLAWILGQGPGPVVFVVIVLFFGTVGGLAVGLDLFYRTHFRAVVGCIGQGRNAITISKEREGPHRRSLHFQGRWWLWVLVRALTCRVLILFRLRYKKFSLVESPTALKRLLRSMEHHALSALQEAELRDEAQFTLILASPIFLDREVLFGQMVQRLTRPSWEIRPVERTLPRVEAALGWLQFDWAVGANGVVLAPGIEITRRRPEC